MHRLNQLLEESNSPALPEELLEKFATYLDLLQRWNQKTNLTAIRDSDGILRRHFLESILCARTLPEGISTLLDFGSGAGFPGLPIAIIRPELTVTLAESQNKKAAFLREAVRTLGLATKVHSGRAELLDTRFDCVTLRAVDKMDQALPAALALTNRWLAILTTREESPTLQSLLPESAAIQWHTHGPLPPATNGILLMGEKQA